MQIGIAGVLGIVFIVLKLCEVIAWSWLWVLAPFWIFPLFVLVMGAMSVVFIGISHYLFVKNKHKNRRDK